MDDEYGPRTKEKASFEYLFTLHPLSLCQNRRGSLVVKASVSLAGGRGFDPGPRQTKVFKTGRSRYPA